MASSHRVVIPARVMRDLRATIPAPVFRRRGEHSPKLGGRMASQEDAARLLGVSRRAVQGWETETGGSVLSNGWAYVGLAFRFGTAPLALQVLAQADLPGSEVWGRDAEDRAQRGGLRAFLYGTLQRTQSRDSTGGGS